MWKQNGKILYFRWVLGKRNFPIIPLFLIMETLKNNKANFTMKNIYLKKNQTQTL